MRQHAPRIAARIGEYALTIWAALTINFALPHLAPGDPLTYILGQWAGSLSTEQRAELLTRYGLDQPLHEQYLDYLWGILHGDLGVSLMTGDAVSTVLLDRLPWTVLLVGTALILATLIGVLLGAISAWRRGEATDVGLLGTLLTFESAPAFWIGMILLSVFAVQLGWLPSYGTGDLGSQAGWLANLASIASHLWLPLLTLVIARVGGTYLIARGSTLTALSEDHLLLAKAKGLSDRVVLFNHALRNALLPIYTRFTLDLGAMIGGSVVVETVFAYPGLGRLIYEAALARDYPVLQGAFLLLTLTVVLANLLADLTYPLIDPRAGTEAAREAPA